MKRILVFTALMVGLIVSAGVGAAAAKPAPPNGLEVTLNQQRLSIVVGDKFSLRSEITNRGPVPTEELVAHLNVASLNSDVYVDPEDWSSHRSATVAQLQPGTSTAVNWELQSVNTGSFDIYVVLLPNGPASSGSGPLIITSSPVHVTIIGRRTLNSGGSLPVVIAVPAVLGLILAATRFRIRRTA